MDCMVDFYEDIVDCFDFWLKCRGVYDRERPADHKPGDGIGPSPDRPENA